jgi:hypothetical protein
MVQVQPTEDENVKSQADEEVYLMRHRDEIESKR